jgi:hypothetical protein
MHSIRVGDVILKINANEALSYNFLKSNAKEALNDDFFLKSYA